MSQEQASLFAGLALKGIQKEYPNKPGNVLNSKADVKGPRALHPAFYGSFDWHSSVHGHWMLLRLLRQYPDLPERKKIRQVLSEHLTAKNLKAEADYFAQPNAQSFERPYGWSWLLKLAEELHDWDDPDAKEWAKNFKPLTDTIVNRYLSYFPKQTYPILSVLSSLPETRRWPSGLKLTLLTEPVCPLRERTSFPLWASHTLYVHFYSQCQVRTILTSGSRGGGLSHS